MLMLHILLDLLVATLGALLNLTLLYLIVTVARRVEPGIRTALCIGAGTDLLYCISTLVTLFSGTSGGSITFLTINNPFVPPDNHLIVRFLVAFNIFTIFLSMMTLALQFVSRYGVMRNKPFTPLQLLGVFAVIAIYNVAHCSLTWGYDYHRTAELDELLRDSLQLDSVKDVPPYVSGDPRNTWMLLQSMDILCIMTYVYGVILTTVFKSGRSMTLTSESLSDKTQRIQQQLTRVLYVQACYPLLSVCVPCLLYSTVAIAGAHVHYTAETAILMVHTTPTVNASLVLAGMSMFRHRLVRRARKMLHTAKVSTKFTASTVDKSTTMT